MVDEEIKQFYGDDRFPNAICKEFLPTRPDRMVVCAYDGDEIVGMADCSEDAPGWMQIGIDVLHSWNIVLNSGFIPAWVEIGAQKLIL